MIKELHVQFIALEAGTDDTSLAIMPTPQLSEEAFRAKLKNIMAGDHVPSPVDLAMQAHDDGVVRAVKQVFGDTLDTEHFDSETAYFEQPQRTLMFTITGADPTLEQGNELVRKLTAAGYQGAGCAPALIPENAEDEAAIDALKP